MDAAHQASSSEGSNVIFVDLVMDPAKFSKVRDIIEPKTEPMEARQSANIAMDPTSESDGEADSSASGEDDATNDDSVEAEDSAIPDPSTIRYSNYPAPPNEPKEGSKWIIKAPGGKAQRSTNTVKDAEERRARTDRMWNFIEATNGKVAPSANGEDWSQTAPPVGRDNPGGKFPCPRCSGRFTTSYHLQSHWVSCISKYGNPKALTVFESTNFDDIPTKGRSHRFWIVRRAELIMRRVSEGVQQEGELDNHYYNELRRILQDFRTDVEDEVDEEEEEDDASNDESEGDDEGEDDDDDEEGAVNDEVNDIEEEDEEVDPEIQRLCKEITDNLSEHGQEDLFRRVWDQRAKKRAVQNSEEASGRASKRIRR